MKTRIQHLEIFLAAITAELLIGSLTTFCSERDERTRVKSSLLEARGVCQGIVTTLLNWNMSSERYRECVIGSDQVPMAAPQNVTAGATQSLLSHKWCLIPSTRKVSSRFEKMIDWPGLRKYFDGGAFRASAGKVLVGTASDTVQVRIDVVEKSKLALAFWRATVALFNEVHGELTFQSRTPRAAVQVALTVDYSGNRASVALRSRVSF